MDDQHISCALSTIPKNSQPDGDRFGRQQARRPRCWLPGLDLAPADEFVAAALGADPDVRDARFDSTPLGWAHHFGQEELIALLAPVTSPEPTRDEECPGEAEGG